MVIQKHITLPPYPRGVHIISKHIEDHISGVETGIANIFLKHTSASLALNENYDPSVRNDIESFLRTLIPDGYKGFTHTLEGADDMPAHMKNILIGSSLTIPITNGSLNLGTWQGVYLLEHRIYGESRELVLTVLG